MGPQHILTVAQVRAADPAASAVGVAAADLTAPASAAVADAIIARF